MVYRTKFESDLRRYVKGFGGAINAHAHLDRAETLGKIYLADAGIDPLKASELPLEVKQNLTGELHKGPAYTPEDLRKRMSRLLKAMSKDFNVKMVHSAIDTTADNVGLTAIDVAMHLKDELKGTIDFQVGSYPIFGFRDSDPERWKVFEEASKYADFMCVLPERDERKGHIGYKEHLRRVLHLAAELGKPLHVHVDQGNDPNEHGTEELVHAVDYCMPPAKRLKEGRPLVWAVHMISPSAYEESRFRDLLDGLYDCSIGVICCPTAAISMKQKREIMAPTHNSIARMADIMAHRIPLRLGSDNIADIFVPTGTPNMYLEAMRANDYVRFYSPEIFAKLLADKDLNEMDIHKIRAVTENGS